MCLGVPHLSLHFESLKEAIFVIGIPHGLCGKGVAVKVGCGRWH